MERFPQVRALFAIMLVGTGVWGFAVSGFVAIWAPGISQQQLRWPMVVACSLISVAAGAGLLWPRFAPIAARVLLAFLCLWLLWSKGMPLIRAPKVLASWESLGETAVVTSAAWALAARRQNDANEARRLTRIAAAGPFILYGLSLIAFGAAHVGYSKITASLVPAWLPWHLFWVYFTAATYLVAGAAIVAGILEETAARLSALQMGLFGVLVWLPKILGGAHDPDTLNETAISFFLSVSGWVIASAIRSQASAMLAPGVARAPQQEIEFNA